LINFAILLEQEYVIEAVFLSDVPKPVLKTIHDLTEASTRAYLQQNNLTINSAKVTKQGLSHLMKIHNPFLHKTKK